MNNEWKKTKKRAIFLFLSCLCIACICFGIFAYLVVAFRGKDLADQTPVTIAKIIVLLGIFFLVLAFGYMVPVLNYHRNVDKGNTDISGYYNETAMMRALGKYIPQGETLLAGIHVLVEKSSVTCVFGECILTEDRLLPNKNGGTVAISKTKCSSYDIYLGITQNSLVVADCEPYRYLYEFDEKPNDRETSIQIVTEDILLTDIGKCFRLTDVQSCNLKKGSMGSEKCTITMKNGNYFNLRIQESGGIHGYMPHHAEYLDAILTRLNPGSR